MKNNLNQSNYKILMIIISFMWCGVKNKINESEILKLKEIFEFSKDDSIELYKSFKDAIVSNKNNSMFLNTYITLTDEKKPMKADEKKMLAIDVGGSYLKLKLFEKNVEDKNNLESIKIERDTDSLSKIDIFDWISDAVEKYLKDKNACDEPLKAALTFSYPIKHESISTGITINMTKRFPFKKNKKPIDPLKTLNRKFRKKNIKVDVQVLLNDTAATLLASYQNNKNTKMAVVLGTGTNAAFILNGKVINSEWGMFMLPFYKKTPYDYIKKDEEYVTVEDLIGGLNFEQILKKVLSEFQIDGYSKIEEYIENYYVNHDDYRIIEIIKSRTFSILSCLIAALDTEMESEICYIGINGSGLQKSKDQEMLKDKFTSIYREILGKNKSLFFIDVQNASLIGSVYALEYAGRIPNN